MPTISTKTLLALSASMLLLASAANAKTLTVNCGARTGLNSIGAALRVLQGSEESRGPNTINVSGACKENVVIQSMDRLTLNAVRGASITDASRGTLSVVDMEDSHDVAINGFIVNAGSDGLSFANGIVCGDTSICRFSGDTVQGAADGAGLIVFGMSTIVLNGDDVFQGNSNGLQIVSGITGRGAFVARENIRGVLMRRGVHLNAASCTVEQNSDSGIVVVGNSTLQVTDCTIRDNGVTGVVLRGGAYAQLNEGTITGNANFGVELSDLSFADFGGIVVTGNHGGTDVTCGPQYSATRGTSDIGGGTTNCVEP